MGKNTIRTWNTAVSQENSLHRTRQHSATCQPVVESPAERRQRTGPLFVARPPHLAVFSRKDGYAGCEKDSNLWVQDLEKTPGGEFFSDKFLELSIGPSCRVWARVITVDEHTLAINQSRTFIQQCSPYACKVLTVDICIYCLVTWQGLKMDYPIKHSTSLCRGGGPVLAQILRFPPFRYPLPFARKVCVCDG